MKNLKMKVLLSLSVLLILIVWNTCWAIEPDKCPFLINTGEHSITTIKTHKFDSSGTCEIIKKCSLCTYVKEGTIEYGHHKKTEYEVVDENYHKLITKCTKCEYREESSKQQHSAKYEHDDSQHWQSGTCDCGKKLDKFKPTSHNTKGTNGSCSVCGYVKKIAGSTCVALSQFGTHIPLSGTSKTCHDAQNHWTESTCSYCGTKYTMDKANHSYGSASYTKYSTDKHKVTKKCKTCGYGVVREQAHSFKAETDYSFDSETHYKKSVCTACKETKKLSEGKHILSTNVSWSYDSTNHWQNGTCSVCNEYIEKFNPTKHTLGTNKKCTCSGCDYTEAAGVVVKPVSISIVGGRNVACTEGEYIPKNIVGTVTYEPNNATLGTLTWTSSNPSVITISKDGSSISILSAGKATIFVTTPGKSDVLTASRSIEVVEHQMTDERQKYDSTEHWNEKKCTLCGKTVKSNVEAHVYNNEHVCKCGRNNLTSIMFGRTKAEMCIGERKSCSTLAGEITWPSDVRVSSQAVTWSSSNSSILFEDDHIVTAKKIGKANIICKTNYGTATCTVEVLEHNFVNGKCARCDKAGLDEKTIWFDNSTAEMCVGATSKFFDVVGETNGDLAWDAKVTRASSNTAVLKVEGTSVTAIKTGTAVLSTTTEDGKVAKCTVKVLNHNFVNGKCTRCKKEGTGEETVTSELKIDSATICLGYNTTGNGKKVSISSITNARFEPKATDLTIRKWTSSDTSVLEIKNSFVNAKKVGTVKITATASNGSTATCNIKVVEHDLDYKRNETHHWKEGSCKLCLIKIEKVEEAHSFGANGLCKCGYGSSKEKVTKELSFGRTDALLCVEHSDLKSEIECAMIAVPKILPENATNNTLTWSSSDDSILEIKNGYAVAKQKGKVLLTAKTSNGLTAICNVEVVDHEKAADMKYNYNGMYHWRYGICGLSLEDVYNVNEEKHTFVDDVCKCGKKSVTTSGESESIGYVDVKKGDWYEESVDYVTGNEIMNGMGESQFGPNTSMTRAMVVTVLYRMSNSTYSGKSGFIDVSEVSYYASAVAWASENGIVKGIGDNSFAPDAEVTREQLITILYRYAKYTKTTLKVTKNSNLSEYEDYEKISEYSLEAFEWGYEEKIISGRTETTLNPKGTASRAEVATMLMRFEGEK